MRCTLAGAALLLAVGSLPAQDLPPEVAAAMRGAAAPSASSRAQFHALTNGLVAVAAPGVLPRNSGIDWERFGGGAAYAMRIDPASGPQCAGPEPSPRIEFWILDADSTESRMAVNPGQQLGLVYLQGNVVHYIQAPDFCESKRFVVLGEPSDGYLYAPFRMAGHSPRNFMASAASDVRQVNENRVGGAPTPAALVPALVAFPPFDARLLGYASFEYFGQSQALGEGAGAALTADVLGQLPPEARARLAEVPGMSPGADAVGWLELTFASRPAEFLQQQRAEPLVYLQLRVVHRGTPTDPGRALPALLRELNHDGQLPFALSVFAP